MSDDYPSIEPTLEKIEFLMKSRYEAGFADGKNRDFQMNGSLNGGKKYRVVRLHTAAGNSLFVGVMIDFMEGQANCTVVAIGDVRFVVRETPEQIAALMGFELPPEPAHNI